MVSVRFSECERYQDMRLTKEEDIKLAREGYEALTAQFPESREQGQKQIRGSKAKSKPFAGSTRKSLQSGDLSKVIRLIVGGKKERSLPLPNKAVEALTKILGHLAKGREVTVAAQPAHLTTQQAADFLHVSRPFLVGLLEKGEIPFHKVGTHRRIRFSDLEAYKEKIDRKRLKALEELSKQAQELNLGY